MMGMSQSFMVSLKLGAHLLGLRIGRRTLWVKRGRFRLKAKQVDLA